MYDSPVDVYSDVPVVSIVDDLIVEPREVIVPWGTVIPGGNVEPNVSAPGDWVRFNFLENSYKINIHLFFSKTSILQQYFINELFCLIDILNFSYGLTDI